MNSTKFKLGRGPQSFFYRLLKFEKDLKYFTRYIKECTINILITFCFALFKFKVSYHTMLNLISVSS